MHSAAKTEIFCSSCREAMSSHWYPGGGWELWERGAQWLWWGFRNLGVRPCICCFSSSVYLSLPWNPPKEAASCPPHFQWHTATSHKPQPYSYACTCELQQVLAGIGLECLRRESVCTFLSRMWITQGSGYFHLRSRVRVGSMRWSFIGNKMRVLGCIVMEVKPKCIFCKRKHVIFKNNHMTSSLAAKYHLSWVRG